MIYNHIQMTEKEIRIVYTEYSSFDELSPEDRELAEAAVDAMGGAYAPYSHFHVGAAVRLSDGSIVKGANQENAAFPSGLCAERTAMFAASAQFPGKDMLGIAIAGGPLGRRGANPAAPCGACRQVMAEYQAKSGKPMSVMFVASGKILKFGRVDDILPFIFNNI